MTPPLPEPTVIWALFSWRGRLGRNSYFLGAALVVVIQIYLGSLIIDADNNNDNQMVAWGFTFIFTWIASALAILAMTIKRLHDLNLPAFMAIGLLFPFLGLLFIILMMFLPGSQNTNEHGPPPFPKKKI